MASKTEKITASQVWKQVEVFVQEFGQAKLRFESIVKTMAHGKLTVVDILREAQKDPNWPTNEDGKKHGLTNALKAYKGKAMPACLTGFNTFQSYFYTTYRVAVNDKKVPKLNGKGEVVMQKSKGGKKGGETNQKVTIEFKAAQEAIDKMIADKKLANAAVRAALIDFCAALKITVNIPAGK